MKNYVSNNVNGKVVLKKNYDDKFAILMPYQKTKFHSIIENRMKKYYVGPKDIVIEWIGSDE